MTCPAVGSAISDPTAVHSSSVPICPDEIPRISVTAGILAAQLAKTRPLAPKMTNVARAAEETCRTASCWVAVIRQL
jgi:hypothetical protein